MISCPHCQHQELTGSLFCSLCGAQLDEGMPTQPIITAPTVKMNKPRGDPSPASRSNQSRSWVRLTLLENGVELPRIEKEVFTLGRLVKGLAAAPDVDLSQYNAFANGVSRLHASLRIHQGGILVRDLGSSNGTFVNGEPLAAHIERPLADGDLLSLGTLKIKVLFS